MDSFASERIQGGTVIYEYGENGEHILTTKAWVCNMCTNIEKYQH